MPLMPVKYKDWSGIRTRYLTRLSAVVYRVIAASFSSKGILSLFIIGIVLVHAFPGVFLVMTPHTRLTAWMLVGEGFFGWTYLTSGVFSVFIFLLSAGVTSNLISQDLRNKSFVIYFSRPLGVTEYIIGKLGGAFLVMSTFCTLPTFVVGLMIIATQTGPNYAGGFRVLLLTLIAGFFASVLFLPYGMMLSSLTKRKAYAGIGTFMTLFSLTVVSEFFSNTSANWNLVNPMNVLHYSFELIYGFGLPLDIDSRLYAMSLFLFLVPPLMITAWRVKVHEEVS
ncbi:MAG: hypothetical protein R6U17_03155 [Thermoplasmata archaeon]